MPRIPCRVNHFSGSDQSHEKEKQRGARWEDEAGRRVRTHRTPAEPAPVWHMATRSSMSAFEAIASPQQNTERPTLVRVGV